MRRDYTSVNIPKDLCILIEKIIRENPELGYTSVSEFIKDTSRRRIEELEQRKLRLERGKVDD